MNVCKYMFMSASTQRIYSQYSFGSERNPYYEKAINCGQKLIVNGFFVICVELERHGYIKCSTQTDGNDNEYVYQRINQNWGNIDNSYPDDRARVIRIVADIANNINQMARIANAKGDIYFSDIDKQQCSLDDVKKTFEEVLETW